MINVINNIITTINRYKYTQSFEYNGFNINNRIKLIINITYVKFNLFNNKVENIKIINKNIYYQKIIHKTNTELNKIKHTFQSL